MLYEQRATYRVHLAHRSVDIVADAHELNLPISGFSRRLWLWTGQEGPNRKLVAEFNEWVGIEFLPPPEARRPIDPVPD